MRDALKGFERKEEIYLSLYILWPKYFGFLLTCFKVEKSPYKKKLTTQKYIYD